ncbi:uncharacterized protein N7473_011191 [Penicillium subrubescens]|uniref:uncharacterized protein n=1 Tax=Penicillium subrubescens TaxID=1316194 RepID=UPI002544DE19|nr:uncharacterized protein N7473_013118 [Penicillium subrubescens]XP_057004252.1 uncharacterized protein N7473_011191 [Penicillium subrubescens]KAJ5875005.1 hypothetical protein N7473_013118 [Penicillium subrubescens]KAJ5882757.1 hypothetical protein N7473_011191 [Penicillium subrubescens]
MVLSDPATMEMNESLALVLAPISLEHSILSALCSMPDVPDTLSGYTFLDVRRSLKTGKWDDLYSKIIRFDEFDFLYLLLFDIYKCRPDSLISVGNLCGGRMRLIRLWKKWFTENGAPDEHGSETSSQTLFTKIVWAGPNFDVGFLVSATESGPDKQAGSGPSSHVITRPGADTKFYRVKIEKMLVQDHYLLGLLEGFNPSDR